MRIQSLQNPKVKEAIKLRNRKERDHNKQFLIEGFREISRGVEAHLSFSTLFYCPSFFLKEGEKKLVEKFQEEKIPCYECSKPVFEKLSYRDRPDGLVAIAPFFHKDLEAFSKKLSSSPFIVVAESIEKPGNLGTILRSCDASGVDALIICDPCTDMYNPNVVRASTGTLFSVPVIPASLQETFAFLKEHNITICAATPQAEKEFTQQNLQGSIAVVVGCEQYGLTEHWFEKADCLVKIPMKGRADSLNVAQATTLLLYEVLRQRS